MTRRDASPRQATHTPRPVPAVALRDITDDELSEAIDSDREQAEQLLHADTRWCPACRQPTLASRQHTCLFCDGPTFPYDVRDARVSTSSQRRCRPTSALGAAAACENTDKEEAA